MTDQREFEKLEESPLPSSLLFLRRRWIVARINLLFLAAKCHGNNKTAPVRRLPLSMFVYRVPPCQRSTVYQRNCSLWSKSQRSFYQQTEKIWILFAATLFLTWIFFASFERRNSGCSRLQQEHRFPVDYFTAISFYRFIVIRSRCSGSFMELA